MFNIQEELKKLPSLPGVYIMKDSADTIIYVGKAVVLKNRVKQYFQKSSGHTPKVQAMVSKIASFEYIVTDTEKEALILECNLIKHYRPRYNILLKDDKAYPYIKITMSETYPRVMMARRLEKDGSRYFGPYISNYSVSKTIETLTKIFPLKTCSRHLPDEIGKKRPCLNYHLGRCKTPCQGGVSFSGYREIIDDICEFLSGRSDEIISRLEKEMMAAAENLNFEKAAELRDRIQHIAEITDKQKAEILSADDLDVIALAKNDTDTCVQVFFIRGGKILGRDHFILEGTGPDPDEEILSSFIMQFYEDAAFYPHTILIPEFLQDHNVIEEWLTDKKGSKVILKVPQRGEKVGILKMAESNARISLENFSTKFRGITGKNMKLLEKFASLIGAQNIPARIEAYDVSNTGRNENVASMVVFENGRPAKKEYKRFKIKMEEWQGDIPSMREVLERRFRHDEIPLPDLLLVDGGAAHVSLAKDVIEESSRDDLKNIIVMGMVKDDKHRTRGLVDENHREIELKHDLDIFRFVTSIQNEAHRFALEYNKKLRDKRYSASALDDIPGIGKSRKTALIKHFGSIAKIKKAGKDELMKVKGITETTAENIINYFSKKE